MRASVLLVTCSTMSVLACGSDTPTGNGPPAVASVVVTPVNASLVSLGETVQLTASAQDASGNTLSGKTFTWSSSGQSVATVGSSGLVTAVANGSATITATTDGVNGTATVDVSQVATLAFKRENGQPTSHPPLGFRVNGSRKHRMLPIPEELEIVRQILGLWRTGLSHRAIAAKLNADGVSTKHGARWHHTTVGKVVQRRDWYLAHLSES